MQGNRKQWEWQEGKVDFAAPHMKLFFGDWGDSSTPVALVAEPVKGTFVVEFLNVPHLNESENQRLKVVATKELSFYLVEKGEHDPWKYAIFHCGTQSNFYSELHWAYFPGDSA